MKPGPNKNGVCSEAAEQTPVRCLSWLEGDLQTKLQVAGIEGAARLAKGAGLVRLLVAPATGKLEVGVVQHIECLRTEFHFHPLRDPDVLEQGRFPGYIAGANEAVS